MKKLTITLALMHFILTGCSPIKPAVTNQYKLSAFSQKSYSKQAKNSMLVTMPETVAGYKTNEMLYIDKPFELQSFVHNAWIDPPANMLFPLIFQSLERSGYFYAVATSPISEKINYRLDTQLIELHQNFLQKPSTIQLTVKTVLTHVTDNRIIASRTFSEKIPCPYNTPYGGVIAANRATNQFTAQMTQFVINHINNDH